MASRAVVPPKNQQQQPRGEVKQKIIAAERRTRRVLQDIGNLALDRAKPLPAKKISVRETKLDDNNNRPPQKIVTENNNKKSSNKAFTSVLSARSKAEAAATRRAHCSSNNDIDGADTENELAVVEYVDDMYKFYKSAEDENRVEDYMDSQLDINAKMRSILIDWLIEVHRKFELMPETLYLTVNIVDRFLESKAISRRELQLVGISSMLIASKYEEIWAPEVNDFVKISANAYVREEVLLMEKAILGKLEWYLTVPTPYVFLVRYVKASESSDKEMENMVFYLAELGLVHYPVSVSYSPSMIAAAAVYGARWALETRPLWTATLKHHTGYDDVEDEELIGCAKVLVSLHCGVADSKLKAVYRKFCSSDRCQVALRKSAKELV